LLIVLDALVVDPVVILTHHDVPSPIYPGGVHVTLHLHVVHRLCRLNAMLVHLIEALLVGGLELQKVRLTAAARHTHLRNPIRRPTNVLSKIHLSLPIASVAHLYADLAKQLHHCVFLAVPACEQPQDPARYLLLQRPPEVKPYLSVAWMAKAAYS
jgi:hypothetical protein